MLKFDRKSFSDAFNAVAAACPARTDKDIYKSVLLSWNNTNPVLSGTDGTRRVSTVLPAVEGDKREALLIPAARAKAIIGELDQESFELGLDDFKVLIKTDSSTFRLQTEDPSGFPEMPSFDWSKAVSFNPVELKRALAETMFCVDPDSTRYALGGVQFFWKGSAFRISSTDSRRMSTIIVSSERSADCGWNPITVPHGLLKLVEPQLADGKTCLMALAGNTVAFQICDTVISGQVLEGRFPDVTKVTPSADSFRTKSTIPAKSMLSLIRQVLITTNEESRGCDLQFTKSELVMNSGAKEIGQTKVRMPIVIDGDEVAFTLDGRYLSDYLRVCGDRSVEVGIIAADDRVSFTVGEWKHVIMPLAKD